VEIREATEADIPAIVSLLKLSLGESLMPKSGEYWRWKHIENPFGPSPVLLAWDGTVLVGVRAFMRWEWVERGRVYRAVRAVDTATHPEYQGKGIFKKLTLSLVAHCTKLGDDFVFNTPNSQSKPGYIKMGWVEAGKMPVRFSIRRPLHMGWNFLTKKEPKIGPTENGSLRHYLEHPGLSTLLENHLQQEKIVTNVSVPYLAWRYLQVPVADYVGVGLTAGDALTGLIIARIKQTRLGRELRITDCFLDHRTDKQELKGRLRAIEKQQYIDYTTLSGTGEHGVLGLGSIASGGPMVTVRSLGMTDLNKIIKFHLWSPALGDLELF
jgi:GNAT superfamily N-acetyltransferase